MREQEKRERETRGDRKRKEERSEWCREETGYIEEVISCLEEKHNRRRERN